MTTGKITQAIMGASAQKSRGRREWEAAIGAMDVGDRIIPKLGIRGLTYLIEQVLDEHYPAEVFGDGSILVDVWQGDDLTNGLHDFDPGVKWCALLRKAIDEIRKVDGA